jgi:hypothetical protein
VRRKLLSCVALSPTLPQLLSSQRRPDPLSYQRVGPLAVQGRPTSLPDQLIEVDCHSNTVENVFSLFKRCMEGVYQYGGGAPLSRYLTEFELRYNRRGLFGRTDGIRTGDPR